MSMSDFINTRFDRYQIQERIGAGGMARVFKAHDPNLGRPVAIKILHEHLAEDPAFKQRFEREARIIASFNHPNIVQVYDFNTIERDNVPIYYMVMSFIPGETLSDLLDSLRQRDDKLSRERVLEIMLDLTNALGYAHERGMIHRDVKPGNILMNESAQAVLTDFGIARMVESSRLTVEGTSTGTPAYMSPEQARGEPGDARSDLYSLGIILFEMLTGRPPFGDEGGVSLMLKHINEPIPEISEFIPNVSTDLNLFIQRVLAKDPDSRYQTATEFADALQIAFGTKQGQIDGAPLAETITAEYASLAGVIQESPTTPAPMPIASEKPKNKTNQRIIVAGSLIGVALIAIAVFIAASQLDSDRGNPEDIDIRGIIENQYFRTDFDTADETRANWSTGELVPGVLTAEFTPENQYRLTNERPNTAITTIYDPGSVFETRRLNIRMEGRLTENSATAGAFGIVFGFQDDNNYNVFAVDGEGRYSVWVRSDGFWCELRVTESVCDPEISSEQMNMSRELWTEDGNVAPLGEENVLVLDSYLNVLTGYVNGRKVFDKIERNNLFESGNLGIYIATTEEGITESLIDRYIVTQAVAPSMTGAE